MTAWMNEPTVWADFNELEDDGIIGTTLFNTPGLLVYPAVHGLVRLQDDDGLSCMAFVIYRDEDYITCRVVPGSWKDTDQ